MQDLLANARHRVLLSALYLGSSPTERALLASLSASLAAAPALTAHLMFDHARGRRRDRETGHSSLSLCAELAQRHPGRVSAAFFAPPLRHSRAEPRRNTDNSGNNSLTADTTSQSTRTVANSNSSSSSSSTAAVVAAATINEDGDDDIFAAATPLPERLRGRLWALLQKHLPGRGNELLTVHHMKLYIVDDTLVSLPL